MDAAERVLPHIDSLLNALMYAVFRGPVVFAFYAAATRAGRGAFTLATP
jgi:hypothetical protein